MYQFSSLSLVNKHFSSPSSHQRWLVGFNFPGKYFFSYKIILSSELVIRLRLFCTLDQMWTDCLARITDVVDAPWFCFWSQEIEVLEWWKLTKTISAFVRSLTEFTLIFVKLVIFMKSSYLFYLLRQIGSLIIFSSQNGCTDSLTIYSRVN